MSHLFSLTILIIVYLQIYNSQRLRNNNENKNKTDHINNEVSIFNNMNYFIYENSEINDILANSTDLTMIINITDTIRYTVYSVSLQ
jgi:hypothetical protein